MRTWTITTGTHVLSRNEWDGSFSPGGGMQRASKAKAERRDMRLACLAGLNRATPKPPFRITLTRIAPRKLDDDNLRGGLKHVRDGVADALKIDDRESPMLSWDYAQERGRPKEYGLRIEIKEQP